MHIHVALVAPSRFCPLVAHAPPSQFPVHVRAPSAAMSMGCARKEPSALLRHRGGKPDLGRHEVEARRAGRPVPLRADLIMFVFNAMTSAPPRCPCLRLRFYGALPMAITYTMYISKPLPRQWKEHAPTHTPDCRGAESLSPRSSACGLCLCRHRMGP